ncbi:MAG: hypothetical protein JSS09_06625, partial [Verrucomicrobia bacterium]|nr:hypothetical protein [Verrucomicrobiota bacterium]
MSFPRIMGKIFNAKPIQRFTFSPSSTVASIVLRNFTNHPSSYTLISLDINRASYPSKAPLIGMPRAFSTSKPNPEISKGL